MFEDEKGRQTTLFNLSLYFDWSSFADERILKEFGPLHIVTFECCKMFNIQVEEFSLGVGEVLMEHSLKTATLLEDNW